MKIHHPNVNVAMKMLVFIGKVLGTELTPKRLAINQKDVLAFNLACSSLQTMQEEIQM